MVIKRKKKLKVDPEAIKPRPTAVEDFDDDRDETEEVEEVEEKPKKRKQPEPEVEESDDDWDGKDDWGDGEDVEEPVKVKPPKPPKPSKPVKSAAKAKPSKAKTTRVQKPAKTAKPNKVKAAPKPKTVKGGATVKFTWHKSYGYLSGKIDGTSTKYGKFKHKTVGNCLHFNQGDTGGDFYLNVCYSDTGKNVHLMVIGGLYGQRQQLMFNRGVSYDKVGPTLDTLISKKVNG